MKSRRRKICPSGPVTFVTVQASQAESLAVSLATRPATVPTAMPKSIFWCDFMGRTLAGEGR